MDLSHLDEHEATAYKLGALTAQAIAAAVEADRKQRFVTRSQVLTWDWKEDAPLDDIGRAIEEASDNQVHLYPVDTGSDQVAIVVSNGFLTTDEAQEIFRAQWDSDWDVD